MLSPNRRSVFACLVVVASVRLSLADSNWPQFRGPGGSGVSPGGDFPVSFGPSSNVAWKVPVPPGHSSPCIVGDQIFLTGYDDGQLETLCIERRDGEARWTRRVAPGTIEQGSALGSPAASTPTADGKAVYVYFSSFGLVSYDHEGNERWRLRIPTPITQHGASSSPVLAGDRLILACDQDVGSFLIAVDGAKGQTIWKTPRPGFRRGFSTPLLWPQNRPRHVVVAGTLCLAAYDLQSGDERWRARGLPNEMVASPVAGSGLIFASGWTYGSGVEKLPAFEDLVEKGDEDGDGELTRDEAPSGPAKQHFVYVDADKNGKLTRAEWTSMAEIFGSSRNALLAVRPDGRGDVTATHIAWKRERGLPYVPSPIVYEGRVFLVKKGGIASSFDASSGEVCYQQKRLGAFGNYYSSPVAAGGKICVISQRGVAVVLGAGRDLEVLARNELGETTMATPAIVGNRLYVRTDKHLWCFAEGATRSRDSAERD